MNNSNSECRNGRDLKLSHLSSLQHRIRTYYQGIYITAWFYPVP